MVSDEHLDELEMALAGSHLSSSPVAFDLRQDEIFAAISGITISNETSLIGGVTLRPAYSYVIQPDIVAFKEPASAGTPHPPPWHTLRGRGITSYVEIQLAGASERRNFNRLTTLWGIICLLRLVSGLPISVPFVSNQPFSYLENNTSNAVLLPLEAQQPRIRSVSPRALEEKELSWLRSNLFSGFELLEAPHFLRALETLDSVTWHWNLGAGISMAWASIETLLRPGEKQITDRVCKALSALVAETPSERDRIFPTIRDNYRKRGASIHASETPQHHDFELAASLARRAFLKCIELKAIPTCETLLLAWRDKSPIM